MLHLDAADQPAPLAARLAGVLGEAPTDPMAPEWIAVPTEGMRRWLWLELARHLGAGSSGSGDGVAANLRPAFPGTLRSVVLGAGRGEDEPDPWDVTRLVWSVIEVLSHADADPLLAPLTRGYGPARRIADRFDRYSIHRAAMVREWAAGRDVDPLGQPLPAHHLWQPHLWRLVRDRVAVPSPPEALPDLLEQVRADTLALDLPERLSLFGITALPGGASFVELASALAEHREVHVFLLDPSLALSDRVRSEALDAPAAGPRRRSEDATATLVDHPLLRSWARLPRETATLLADAESNGFPVVVAHPVAEKAAGPSLLQEIQQDLRAGRAPAGAHALAAGDRSVQFHATYGPARQVDVLRDVILHSLVDMPDLTEDDIVVICPDLPRFAPLVEAGLGPSAGTPDSWATPHSTGAGAPAIRYRVADRSVGGVDSFTSGVLAVLEAMPGRFGAAEVLDLLALPAVRARFGVSDPNLARIADWVEEANIRWGLDTGHRARFGVPTTITGNSWLAALDRLLLGAAVTDEEPGFAIGGVVPFGIEGDDVDLAGRLADFIARLRRIEEEIARPRPVLEWLELLKAELGGLLVPADPDERQPDGFHQVLAAVADEAETAGQPSTVPITFNDVRRLLTERLVAAPGRPRFFGGGVTITSLNSLRWIPHRVVCLLGMDQQAFGQAAPDGDDLSAVAPLVGDRDPRADARQAVLEAVLSAGERLVVIRDGHDLRTNQEIPPAVVVAELRDTVAATLSERPADEGAHLPVETAHPRQPYDDRLLTPDGLGLGRPFTFDPGSLAAATARRGRADGPLPFLTERLPPVEQPVIELADLHALLADPAKAFLRHRLQVRLPEPDERPSSVFPVNLAGLPAWKVGDGFLSALRRGEDIEFLARLEEARGTYLPGALGEVVAEHQTFYARMVLDEATALGVSNQPAVSVPVDITLSDGTRIVGSVEDGLQGQHRGPARLGVGSSKPKYRLAAWLDLMALTAHDPDTAWRSVTVHRKGKLPKKVEPDAIDLVAVGDDPHQRQQFAESALSMVVDLHRRNQREPLPFFPAVSYAVYNQTSGASEWNHKMGWGEGDSPQTTLVFAGFSYRELMALAAEPHDPPGRGGRVQRYAQHVWSAVERSSFDRKSVAADQEVDAS